MRVRIVETGRRIAPFNDPVHQIPIANQPLQHWQDRMLRGFERVDAPPCLSVPDTLYCTAGMLREFVQRAQGRNAVAVLAHSAFAESSTAVQPGVERTDDGHRFTEVRYLSGGDEEAVDILLDPQELKLPLALPDAVGGPIEIGLPKHPMITLQHWVHILWANQAAGGVEVLSPPRWRGVLKVIWAVIRARSINKWRVLAKLNTIGRNCDIHPSAIVEGSTLGDNVSVGAHARVVFSRLGNDVTIMSGAEVEASTLGDGAIVAQRCGVRACVLYPGAFASQVIMQACVLGRNVFTTPASYSLDLNLDKDIRVMLDGTLHSTRTRFLGSAFGHEVRVGAGIWIASGRELPNHTVAIKHPAEIAAKVNGTPEDGPLVIRDGALVPLTPPDQGSQPV